MASDGFTRDKFRRPEILFQEILRKGAQGAYKEQDENSRFLFRALVLAVDVQGGQLENPDASGGVSHNIDGKKFEVAARLGPLNPPNSVKARVLTDGQDKFLPDERLRVFWPFFPESISVPVKPGEHVYVLFEDTRMQHGLWVAKVPGHSGVNYSPGREHYQPVDPAPLANKFSDAKPAAAGQQKRFDKDEDAAEARQGNKLSSLF